MNTANTSNATPRDYLANSLIRTQRETIAQCAEHMRRAITHHNIVYTGLTALRLAMIEIPDCPRLISAGFHVLYTDRAQRSKRTGTRYLKLPESLRSQPNITYLHGETVITCTHPLVTWAVLAPFLTQTEVIVLADAMLRAACRTVGANGTELTKERLSDFLSNVGDFPGIDKCRAALAFLTTPTDSTMECRTLLAFLRHGLPYPIVHWQTRITNPEALVTSDLAYPDQLVVVEYDGDAHRQDKRQYRWDERKRQALRAQGHTVIVAFADDVLTERGRLALARKVAQALGMELPGKPLPPYRALMEDDRRAHDRNRQRRCRARRRGGSGANGTNGTTQA